MNYRTQTFARALYDNVAEIPRELSFKKGDILTVLQEKYENYDDWWVCSLKNKVGLAPANRLEALPVLSKDVMSPQLPPVYANQMSQSLYDELPDRGGGNANSTYFNFTDSTLSTSYYNNEIGRDSETYSTYQVPICDQEYSTLPSEEPLADDYMALPASSQIDEYMTLPNSQDDDYHDDRVDYTDNFGLESNLDSKFKASSVGSSLSVTPAASSNNSSSDSQLLKRGPATSMSMQQVAHLMKQGPDEAVKYFNEIQESTKVACNRVIELVKSRWTSLDSLKLNIGSIQKDFRELQRELTHLVEYLVFVVHELCCRSSDREISRRLQRPLQQLDQCMETVVDSLRKLDALHWSPEAIVTSISMTVVTNQDILNKIITVARNSLIYIRSINIIVKGNCTLIFIGSSSTINSGALQTSGAVSAPSASNDIIKLLITQIKSQINLTQDSIKDLTHILLSGGGGGSSHKNNFTQHILTSSKFVVRSATQLVTVAKNFIELPVATSPLSSSQRGQVEEAGNKLCDTLKKLVDLLKKTRFEENQKSIHDILIKLTSNIDELDVIFQHILM